MAPETDGTRPRRVLVLTNNYPPHAMGGYELLCQDHVRWLRGRGDEVCVVTTTFGVPGPLRELGGAGEDVRRVLDFHWREYRHARPSGLKLVRGERRQRRAVEAVLDTLRPDIAFTWGLAAVSKAPLASIARRGVPMVAVVEEHWPVWDIEGDAWLSACRRLPHLRAAHALTAGLVAPTTVAAALEAMVPACCSANLAGEIERGRPEWRGRTRVVLNGIDIARFAPAPREPVPAPGGPATGPVEAGLPELDSLRILYAGRVERRKGLHTVVGALGRLGRQGVPATLSVAGWWDDAYREEVIRAAQEGGVADRISWLGPVVRSEMPAVYRAHDVLVCPSIWAEPFGLVPLEAMASGCVVVSTGTGGMAEFMQDGRNCLLFPVEDDAALAGSLAGLRAAPDRAARLREGGLSTAAGHTFERFARELENLAEEARGRMGRTATVA